VLLVSGLALAWLAPAAGAHPRAHTAAERVSAAVAGKRTFHLPRRASEIAIYWRGARRAHVWVALSRDGRRFGRFHRVRLDELGPRRPNGNTYGNLIVAGGARVVRVKTDLALSRLTVLGLTDGGGPAPRALSTPRVRAASVPAQPNVIPRSGWGADESLRFDSTGREVWPPAFYPVQKLIVHHTDTQNNDPNPAATIRSIYYYHAVTLGWGDIGYNFLIDESGRIYEGRHSQNSWDPSRYPAGPTGADSSGNGVTGAHAQGFNSGTVGIALLGTLTNQDTTPAARNALEHLLAWEASAHGIDPRGSSLYTNPVSGTQATFPNIAGHRDVNATECPGGAFYATLPTIRADVAALVAGSPPPPDFQLTASPASATVARGGSASYTISAAPAGSFTGTLSFAASGVPAYSSAAFSPTTLTLPPSGATRLTVATTRNTPTGTRAITVSGSGGGASHSVSVNLTVKRK
jgi:hypothetical protein